MAEARDKAENKEETTNEVVSSDSSSDNPSSKSSTKGIQITIKPVIESKPKKKSVNYYLPVDLIEEVEKKAKKYNKKGSVLLEELLNQIIYDI